MAAIQIVRKLINRLGLHELKRSLNPKAWIRWVFVHNLLSRDEQIAYVAMLFHVSELRKKDLTGEEKG